ncbi:MAG: flagellar basal body rod protein [Bryobacterales bacterium]|nr:flagellar basal body rod protein [Bryobacterales bacterium]
MDALSIAAASGMRARLESLEMLANNLANSATGGYKTDREFYSLYVSADATEAADLGTSASPDTLPVIDKPWTDYSQGVLQVTDNPLDLALSGKGFFAVNGPTGVLYTRNGRFKLTPTGALANLDGMTVRTRAGGTIQTISSSPLLVAQDGTVQQDGQVLGQIQIDSFNEPVDLNKQGMNYFYKLDPKQSAQAATAEVHQGKLEGSNVGSAESAVRLVTVMRQFEMLQKAMNIGADMNRMAIEEVAKV